MHHEKLVMYPGPKVGVGLGLGSTFWGHIGFSNKIFLEIPCLEFADFEGFWGKKVIWSRSLDHQKNEPDPDQRVI